MENQYTKIYEVNSRTPLSYKIKSFCSSPANTFLAAMSLLVIGYFIYSISATITQKIWYLPAIILSLSIHEYAHAKMADFLGDQTPRKTGRLSLNPLKHLDTTGTILMLFTNFGWAKPVQVDPYKCRDPKRAMLSIALAGPLSNLCIAIIAAGLMKLVLTNAVWFLNNLGAQYTSILYGKILFPFLIINLSLMIFNLIPCPPLDGSRVLEYIIPEKYMFKYRRYESIAPFIVMALVFLGAFEFIITPTLHTAIKIIGFIFGIKI